MGDFYQLPPTVGEPMYRSVFKQVSSDMSLLPSEMGMQLFRSYELVELKTYMRSRDDKVHTDIIADMRRAEDMKDLAPKLLRHLKVINRQDVVDDPSWLEAPIIVTSNYERYVINFHKARAFAISKGVPVIAWKKPLAGILATRFSEETLQSLYEKRPELVGIFVQGAPCVLREENINPTRGLANGTSACFHSLCIADSDQPDLYKELIKKARPGEVIMIPVPYSINVEIKFKDKEKNERIQRWPDNLTLQPGSEHEAKAVVIPLLLKIDLKGIKFKKTNLGYRDHLVDLAFAMTFHKIQGQTVDKVILDINIRPGSHDRMAALDFFGLYVGMSRIKTSMNLRILPPQPGKDFRHIQWLKCDAHLKRWMRGYQQNSKQWELIPEM
jgi:hypothetical protein